MKKTLASALAALSLLALTACGLPAGGGDIIPNPNQSENVEPTVTPAPYIDPLSGEGVGKDLAGARPWAVMINNLQQALPQKGVSQAEILYEIPAEGGVTRMMGIFSDISAVDTIGSMRSIRPYYADVALSYDAITVHAGGSEASYTEMASYGMEHLDGVLDTFGTLEVFYRDPERMQYGLEHSMFTSGERLISGAEYKGFRFDHRDGDTDYSLRFSESASEQCADTAEYVRINYNSFKWTSFVYLPESGLYEAYQYGERYVDADNDKQLAFKNVMALFTGISVIDDVGRLSVRLTGSGDGIFCCGGKTVDITWERNSNTDAFTYYLKDGTPLSLGEGHTFIGVVGGGKSAVDFEKDDQ